MNATQRAAVKAGLRLANALFSNPEYFKCVRHSALMEFAAATYLEAGVDVSVEELHRLWDNDSKVPFPDTFKEPK